jgi:two-component system, NarL family, sensor kinase
MTHQNKPSILVFIFTLIFSSLVLINCHKKEDSEETIYSKTTAKKLDKYCSYLRNPSNFFDTLYMDSFNKRYTQLLKEDKIDSAAQVLFIAGTTLNKNFVYDSIFIKTNLRFLAKYERQIADKYYSGLYGIIGKIYYNGGKYDSSIIYLKKSIINAKDYETLQNNADATYDLIYSNLNNGKLEQSLSSGFQSLQLFERLKDTSFQAATYSGIACIYRFQEDYDEAMKYENKGLELVKKTTDTSTILTSSFNKLSLYADMEDKRLFPLIDSTVALYKSWSKKTVYDTFAVNSWLAFKLVSENKLSDAKIILDKLKLIFPKINDEVGIDYYLNAVADYEIKIGKGSENIAYYLKRIPELKKNEDYLKLGLFNQILHDDALQRKDYKNALNYIQQAQIANDSLNNKVLRIKTKELDKKYQTAQKEQKLALQKDEIEQKNTSIALLIASIIGLCLLISAYYLWQKQKTLKQEKVNNMNFTKQLLENAEEERKRIASDLHDSISHELLNLKSIFKQDLTTVNTKIDSIINDIRGISRNLHPVMFDKIGLEPNIEQLVERIQQQNDFMVSTEINYKGSLSSADELQIYRIIQEALTNIIKYAKAHAGKITMEENKEHIFLEIKDNGKGFNVKEALNSGKSFGLHNIIERSRVIGGDAKIQSSPEGTIIHINISKKA